MNVKTILFILTVSISGCTSNTPMDAVSYIPANSNVWHIEIIDHNHLVYADYEGNIGKRDIRSENSQWLYPAGAFVFDLKIADLNNDGSNEILFVTAQGELVVLNEVGKKLWSFASKLPLYNVETGNLTGDSNLEVACGGIDRHVYVMDSKGNPIATSTEVERLVHRIAIGNLSGKGYDEILVIENRTIANLMAIDNDSLITLWRKQIKVPDALVNWENPRGNFFAFSVHIDDLNADGANEILLGDTYFNKQAIMVTDNKAEPLWISDGLPPFKKVDNSQIEFYSTAFVRSADLFPDIQGKEVVSVAGGMFRIWDKDGNLLGSKNSTVGYTDIEIIDNDIFLGSCPNGDNYLYKLHINDQWEEAVESIEFKGIIKDIKSNTLELKKLVDKYMPATYPDKPVYELHIGFGSLPTTEEALVNYQKQMAWFRNKFPYKNLRPVQRVKVIEDTPPLDENGNPWSMWRWNVDAINGTMTVNEILEKAQWIEENEIPTLFYIGHSCMPFITLETAEKILQLAPTYCLGFQTAEDENLERIPRYFEHFFKDLANLCKQYGNKLCITKNKGLWWMSSPANEQVFAAMFKNGRNKVSGAATEDSNSRTPEINLMGRGGLWQAGLLQHNDVSIHGDLFSFNRFHQWEYPKAGHPYLRLLVAHTTMGMTQISTRIREIMPTNDSAEFEATGKESTEIFYHILGKGIIFSPDRKDALGYSPVGIVVHQPPRKWLLDAHNGHAPEIWKDDPELHNAVFPHNGNLWGMTNTPEHAFQKVIFNKQRQFGFQIPATPYGLVAIVPEQTSLDNVANVNKWWHTDGIYIWKKGGPKLTGLEAAEALQTDFEKAAEKLPFRQVNDAVFMQVLRLEEDQFRLVLIDTGWINPESYNIKVKIQMEGNYVVRNILDNTNYPVENRSFNVHVPAGLFTIVDVVPGN